jgi:hypothetical protein
MVEPPVPQPPEGGHLAELEQPARPRMLAIDWSQLVLANEADVLALWQRISPTGSDYSDKLDEIPEEIAPKLAHALLRSGNVRCVPAQPVRDCVQQPIDVPEPAADATLADPCLRRVLALWSIVQLDDHTAVRDALRAIVAIPPPESELTAAALKALPEDDHAARLELYAIAFRAGHRELVNGLTGSLDEPHLIEAVRQHHIDGALDLLSAESHRSVFIAALADEQLHAAARVQAISELVAVDNKPAKEVHAAIVRATRTPSCTVAAAAAQFLVRSGEKKFAPAKPRTSKSASMMRALCVLASYEQGLRPDEPSFLLGYVPKKGVEHVATTYDEYAEVDTDGDGDPHTERVASVIPRDEVFLPNSEEMIRAFTNCSGTTCRTADREFRFSFKGADALLTRIEVVDRPPCNRRAIPNP